MPGEDLHLSGWVRFEAHRDGLQRRPTGTTGSDRYTNRLMNPVGSCIDPIPAVPPLRGAAESVPRAPATLHF